MEDGVGMSELMEIIFDKKPTIRKETKSRSPILSHLLTEDFSKNLMDILLFRKLIVFSRWEEAFDKGSRKLSSHPGYLNHIMFACLCEHECNRNKFDSFISVCALIIKWNEEILERIGVNFQDLNRDIFMVFYRNVLKSPFRKYQDFKALVKFINDHNYLTWEKNVSLVDDPIAPVLNESDANVKKELRSSRPFREVPEAKKLLNLFNALPLAQEVLFTTSVGLPPLPSERDLIMRLVAYGKKEMAKRAEGNGSGEAPLTTETSHGDSKTKGMSLEAEQRIKAALIKEISYGDSTLELDSKTNCIAKQQEEFTRHENVIQAVIRHNHSKKSGHGNSNKQIHEKLDGTLSHLRNTIQALIENLDEFN